MYIFSIRIKSNDANSNKGLVRPLFKSLCFTGTLHNIISCLLAFLLWHVLLGGFWIPSYSSPWLTICTSSHSFGCQHRIRCHPASCDLHHCRPPALSSRIRTHLDFLGLHVTNTLPKSNLIQITAHHGPIRRGTSHHLVPCAALVGRRGEFGVVVLFASFYSQWSSSPPSCCCLFVFL